MAADETTEIRVETLEQEVVQLKERLDALEGKLAVNISAKCADADVDRMRLAQEVAEEIRRRRRHEAEPR